MFSPLGRGCSFWTASVPFFLCLQFKHQIQQLRQNLWFLRNIMIYLSQRKQRVNRRKRGYANAEFLVLVSLVQYSWTKETGRKLGQNSKPRCAIKWNCEIWFKHIRLYAANENLRLHFYRRLRAIPTELRSYWALERTTEDYLSYRNIGSRCNIKKVGFCILLTRGILPSM